jgi:hypothetical protein
MMWQSKCPGMKSRSHYLDQPASSGEHAGILYVCQSGAKVADLTLSGKQKVA